ncbi:hypothetical protein ACFYT4_17750 [Streptomyces sp. NPDC004609]|uniref:hypothetical protein n=1 Tax=Streptomyces sp. NPDC004609 TaxID=3364704 RepID=UPI0036A29136
MSPRTILRSLAIATVAVGATVVPIAVAFAEASPSPKPAPVASDRKADDPCVIFLDKEGVKDKKGTKGGKADPDAVAKAKAACPTGVIVDAVPRGGVAAGERPGTASTAQDGGTTAAITGSATAVLLAAGGYVLIGRRRAARHDG